MKILSSLALCGAVSCAYATPLAQMHNLNGQQKIVITGLPQQAVPYLAKVNNLEPVVTSPLMMLPIDTIKRAPITPLSRESGKQQTVTANNHQTMHPITTINKPLSSKPRLKTQFYVTQGQTYMTAIRQWLANDKLTKVAWSIPDETVKALNDTSVNGELFKGDIESVIKQLGDKLEQPLYFSRNTKGLAAIHNIKGSVDIRWIHGSTLKDVIHNLTTEYQWQWTKGKNGSWMAPDNFAFVAPYPIVIPRGDFAAALNIIIDGYPVQAQLLYATKHIFIVEKE